MRLVGKGIAAGFLASLLGCVAVYLYLCAWTGATTGGDIPVILLSALTYIPLMMVLVFFVPNAILASLIGIGLAAFSKVRGTVARLPLGVLLGVVLSYLIFHDLLPRLFSHQTNDRDITTLLSPLPFVAIYGGFLGAVVRRFYRKMT